MNHEEVGRHWNDNAETWTQLVRAGYDIYRDHLNTPAFFESLPDVSGLRGLDLGCGEGHNTRLLAQRGARLTAIDISETFIRHARETERARPLGIDYQLGSAIELPFPDACFDFATAFMSFMDIPETQRLFAEVFRVLRPGGFLQFSISHPCFDTPYRRNLRDDRGMTYAIEVAEYYRRQVGELDEWTFRTVPHHERMGLRKFRIPRFTHTLSEWFNLLLDAGFQLERVNEPRPSDETVRARPELQDAQVVAFFLHVRVRKPRPA
jgi:ubiquinone/menaquinone biosynthesis C-methylase UbiE